MTGISLILKHDEPVQNEVYMQMGGGGWRIPSAKLASAIDASASLHQLMLNFAHAFYLQATKTALANGSSKIEERLARWLLMADDRVGGDMPLTQEFLAMMLGVRRAGVAVAIQELERRGLISRRRAGVRVVDRASLVALSEDTYQPPFKP